MITSIYTSGLYSWFWFFNYWDDFSTWIYLGVVKKVYRIASILLIVLGTAFSPRVLSVEHFDGNKKEAISKSGKIKPFEGFFIQPNPADHLVFSDQKNSANKTEATITVFSQCGHQIRQFTLSGEVSDKNLQFLSSGFYYLKIDNSTYTEYRKILIN